MKARFYPILGPVIFMVWLLAGATLSAASPLQFSLPRFVATTNGTQGHFIVADELNNDGSPDIVSVTVNSLTRINVLLSSPGGNFQSNTVYNVHPFSSSGYSLQVVPADLNHDGYKDLLTACVPSFSGSSTGTVGVLLNQGDGRFAVNFLTTRPGPCAVVVSDLNHDTHPDLICAHSYTDSVATNRFNLSTFLGDGTGQFTTYTNYYFPLPLPNDGTVMIFNGLVSGDLNQDGNLDLVATVNLPFKSHAFVLMGSSNGFFSFRTNLALRVSSQPRDPQIADLNGDQIPDLAIASGGYHTVDVFWGLGGGNFSALNSYAATSGLRYLTVGDLNGDGLPELVNGQPAHPVSILQNNGLNLFAKVSPTNYASGEKSALADMNNDGRPDLLTVIGTGVNIYTNLTAPSLQINADSNNVRLRWPTWPGYQLESTPAVMGGWTTVTNPPITNNNVYLLTLPRPLAQEFFRLVKP